MGTQQQFCLRWNNHQSNMLSVFDDLFQNEALVDVTLACDGLSIKAHKMVLSACSPYFQSLFLDNPCKHPIVILKDIRFSDLKALMDFMYKGEVNVSQEQLSTLLKTAETLKVRGLTEVAGGGELHNSILSQPGLAQHHPQSTQPTPQLPRSSIPSAPPLPQPTQQPPQLQPQNSGSPSPKRRRARQVHKSERSSSQSEQEDSDSHDLMEPKVEITEDNVDDDRLGEHSSSVMRIAGRRTGNGTSAAVANDYTTNTSQGVSSTHETNSITEAQGFPARGGNVVNLTTPPLLFNPPAAPSTIQPLAPVQSIGQPPVLQGTSQGRERHVRKWNEATLAEAMEAVRTKRLSIIAACRQYEIPWGTLYRRLSLANIRSAYSRNDQNYSQYISMIPQLIQLQSSVGYDNKTSFTIEQDSVVNTAASTSSTLPSSSSWQPNSNADKIFTFTPRKVE